MMADCFQMLFERNTHPTWVFDAATMRVMAASDGALELMGFTREVFAQQHAAELFAPQQHRLIQILADLKSNDRIKRVWRLRHAKGKHVSVMLQRLQFDDCQAVLVEAREMSRQAQLDRALHDSRQRLQALVNNNTAAVYFMTNDDRLEWVNPRCAVPFDDAEPDELVGKSLWDLFDPAVARVFVHNNAQVRQQGQAMEFEETLRQRDGEHTFLSVKVPLFDEHGQVSGVCGISTDITERKRSEHALRQSEERYRLVSQATEDLIWDWDLKANRIIWDGAIEKRLGHCAEDRMQSPAWWIDHLHPEDRDHVVQSALEAIHGSHTSWSAEYRFRRKDDSYATIMHRGLIARDQQGNPYRMIGTMMDITEFKQIEQQLQTLNDTLAQRVAERTATAEQREAQLRTLSADLAHAEQRERRRLAQVLHDHLQQLLVAAKMRLHLLNRSGHTPESIGDSGGASGGDSGGDSGGGGGKGAVSEIGELLQQAIDASRSLTLELYPPVLHNSGLAAALEWLARWMHSKYHLQVTLDLEPGADPAQPEVRDLLFQALRELLFNVVKHAQTDQATVSMRSTDKDDILITVEDQGAGFVPHMASPNDPSRFGLLHLQQRLRILEGQMIIDSTPGKGTRVTMCVPRNTNCFRQAPARHPAATVPAAMPNSAIPLEPGHRSNAIRVLLVDDHKVVREGLISRLSKLMDIDVIGEACDGEAAVRMARVLNPDVVVMDVWMPGMGGVDATRAIRTEQPWVKVIALSMHDEAHMAQAMLDAGASAYLTKDGSCDVLVKQIRHCVATSNATA